MYKSLSAKDYKEHLGFSEDYYIDGMLIYGTWNREKQIQNIKNELSKLKIEFEINELSGFTSRMLEIKTKNKTIWFDVAYGGPLLSEYLHLACLFGSKENILIGSCGGLSKQQLSGDIILPTMSYGDGSTASMYQREIKNNLFESDKNLRGLLKEQVQNFDVKAIEGKTMTCQAMMAETWEDVKNWSEKGFVGVEMEAATVFSISKHFNIPSAAMLVIADNLIEEETVLSDNFSNTKALRDKTIEMMYNISLKKLLSV